MFLIAYLATLGSRRAGVRIYGPASWPLHRTFCESCLSQEVRKLVRIAICGESEPEAFIAEAHQVVPCSSAVSHAGRGRVV